MTELSSNLASWRRGSARGGGLGAIALAALLLVGCRATGGLSGSSAGDTANPTSDAVRMVEGRGSPTGIGGQVWRDGNTNGLRDGAEAEAAGVGLTLWLDTNADGTCQATVDSMFGSTQTAADGSYRFGNLPSGSYCVEVSGGQAPTGWPSTMSPAQAVGSSDVTLNIGLP